MGIEHATSAKLSRRGLLGRAALAGAAGFAGGFAVPRSLLATGGSAPQRRSVLRQGGLSGEITVSFADDTGIRQPHAAAAAEAIQAANAGATIAVDAQDISGTEYQTRLILALRVGRAPDVFHMGGAAIGALAAPGAILPLDDYLAAWPDWQFYPQPVKDAVSYEGQVWAIPYALDTHFLYYRKDLLEQAGLGADWQPASVDGILDAALAVKQNVPDVIPYAIYAGESGGVATVVRGFLPLLYAYGGQLQDDQGRWIIDSPAIRKTFAYYARGFRTDESVPPEVLTTPNPTGEFPDRLGAGTLALLYDGAWIYGPLAAADPAIQENLGHVLFPTETGGPSFTVGSTGNVWFINARTEHPDLAWEFVKAMNATETVAQICLADPHPAARTDATELPEYQANAFLMEATAALDVARFAPPHPAILEVLELIQRATDLVATGTEQPEGAAARYAGDLQELFGESNVIVQS